MNIFKILILTVVSATLALATDIVLISKDIYLNNNGEMERLTYTGNIYGATFSPDKKSVAYVELVSNSNHHYGEREAIPTQIALYDLNSKKKKVILKEKQNIDPKKTLESFSSPIFSSDGKVLYFSSGAWVTSGAIYSIDLTTFQTKFIIDGNSLAVVKSGDRKDYIIVSRHQYFVDPEGGSYDFDWLVSPSGNIIGLVNRRDSFDILKSYE